MQSEDGENDERHLRGGCMSQAPDERRHQRQDNSQVWDQAEKSAHHTEEVEVGQVQKSEYHHAATAQKQPDNQIPYDEGADHRSDQAEHDISGVSVFHLEQHYRCTAYVVLPAQHEVHEKWHEGYREYCFREGAGVGTKHVGPVASLPDRDDIFFFFILPENRFGRLSKGLRLAGKTAYQRLDFAFVIRQVVDEVKGAVVRNPSQEAEQTGKQGDSDKSSQSARDMSRQQKIHQRCQDKRQKNRNQQ